MKKLKCSGLIDGARRGVSSGVIAYKMRGRWGLLQRFNDSHHFSALPVTQTARHAERKTLTARRHRNKRAIMGAQWKVKHREAAANAKGRIFGKLSKEIMIAARSGADPDMNARLRLVVEQAKKASMPRETLERAIKKGAGLLGEHVHFEKLTYEGFAPHKVPVIVECLTDNINRTVSEIRVLFRKGQLGAAGSVSWDFLHQGMIEAVPSGPDADADADADAAEAAIEAGAQEFEPGEEGATWFFTDITDLDAVCKALPDFGFTVQSAHIGYRPKSTVDGLTDEQMSEVEAFLEAIDGHDDVQNVYVGLAG
jgi:YebC/PmpR family DNA-binding regulatory protein